MPSGAYFYIQVICYIVFFNITFKSAGFINNMT